MSAGAPIVAASAPPVDRERVLWIGAMSFEERCFGSLDQLAALASEPFDGIVLEYRTHVQPIADDRIRRRRNWDALRALAERNIRVRTRLVDPYSYRDIQRIIEEVLAEDPERRLVLDISCVTKLHAIALAEALGGSEVRACIAYAVPETYGHAASSRAAGRGWTDVLMLPIGEIGDLTNESASRGIVLTGHEADRLVIALGEFEPAAGVIVKPHTARRPDLRWETERRNAAALDWLASRDASAWAAQHADLMDMSALRHAIHRQVEEARRMKAPVVLYPFGPKPLIFFSAMQLVREHPGFVWFLYPIPRAYDVDYSFGLGQVLWYELGGGRAPEPSPGAAAAARLC